MSSQRISLDSGVFAGRLRDYSQVPAYQKRPVATPKREFVSDMLVVKPAGTSLPSPLEPKATDAISLASPLTPAALADQVVSQPVQAVVPQTPIAQPQAPIKKLDFSPPQVESKPKKSKMSAVMFGMAVLIFLFGMAAVVMQLRTNEHVEAQVKNTAQTKAEAPPEEDKPTSQALSSYAVAPDLPRLVSIPKLDIQARVTRQGVKADGSLKAPGNIYDVGWYENSSKPDEYGAMLLDGHVHGPTKPGIFVDLKSLQKGDTITVERGDHKVFNYKVVTAKTYDKDKIDMAAAMVPVVPGQKGLNLITCTGKIDYSTNEYQQRLIVFAVQQ